MLSDPKLQCYDPEVVKQMLVQDHNMMTDELIDLNALWFTYWQKCADEVTVPILYALGEHDWLWHGNKEHAQEFMGDSRRARELKEVLLLADRIHWSGGRATKDGIPVFWVGKKGKAVKKVYYWKAVYGWPYPSFPNTCISRTWNGTFADSGGKKAI